MNLFKNWTAKQKRNLVLAWFAYMLGVVLCTWFKDWRAALFGLLVMISFNVFLTLYLINRPYEKIDNIGLPDPGNPRASARGKVIPRAKTKA